MFFGLDINVIILFGVGVLIERKGFYYIFYVLSVVRSVFFEKFVYYYVLGVKGMEGDFEKSFNNFIDKNKFCDSVFFYGKVDNVNFLIWYNVVDVFCLSSFGEGSFNVFIEVFLCGCFVVVSEVGVVLIIMLSEFDFGEIVLLIEYIGNVEVGEWWVKVIIKFLYGDLIDSVRKICLVNMLKYIWEWCV